MGLAGFRQHPTHIDKPVGNRSVIPIQIYLNRTNLSQRICCHAGIKQHLQRQWQSNIARLYGTGRRQSTLGAVAAHC